jgi:co-chaperonin GroES (HSP10)
MSKLTIIELSREHLDAGQIPSNYVLVETNDSVYGAKTKNGIIVGFDEDITYADAENPNNENHAADLCVPYGTVYKVPSGLYYNEDDKNSMDWETEMELQVGDMVWYGIMESYNATTILCEGKLYKFISYADCSVAKRGDKVIVLNGMVLIQPLKKQKLSELDVLSEQELDLTRGKVCFIGQPNKRYKQPSYVDHEELNVGDEVIFAPKAYPTLLERKKFMATFDGDELYYCVPRRKIALSI